MAREVLETDAAPRSVLYAQGTRNGPLICVSGMVGIDPVAGELAGPTIEKQTRRALTNCEAVLEAGGATFADVSEVGVLLADPADFAGMNKAYAETLGTHRPARYVARLGVILPGVLVSIRMTAVVG